MVLFHDTGLSFETDAATVDLKNDWARGDQPVEGQNADGELASQGFDGARQAARPSSLPAGAWMKLFPKKSNGGGS